MKRTLASLLLLLSFSVATVHGQETVEKEVEFIRKLRSKGYLDLAKEYAEKLQSRKDPQLDAALPIEHARTLLAIAREKNAEQRFGIFATARKSLEEYVQKNAGKPEAAQGSLEIARLSSYEGQALLTRALREMELADQQKLAKTAEVKFEQASKDLDAAIKILTDLSANYKNPDEAVEKAVKKQLQQELTQARFDKGAVLIDQARTYINTANEEVNAKRAAIIQQAKKVFTPLENADVASVAHLATAWLMKISMEEQAPDDTKKLYSRTMSTKDVDARAAQRLVRYFNLQDILVNPKNPLIAKLKGTNVKLDMVQKEALAWLKDYPTQVKSPEGQGVLWELANSYNLEAQSQKDQKAKATQDTYDLAQKYYAMLAQTEGDYNEKANQVNLSISFVRMGERKEFRTFDDLYLKAQYDMLKMRQAASKKAQAAPKEVDKLDEEWKKHLKEVTQTLNRAVGLANPRTPLAKLDEARFFLASAYMLGGDLYRTAVAGEALARTRPPTRRAPAGAGYAIEAYANLLTREPNDATRGRLQEVVDYVLSPEMQKYWSSDSVTSVARYQLALLNHKDKNFKAAIELLEKVPPEFPAYIYSQGQLVFITAEARAQPDISAAEKRALIQVARNALARIPLTALPSDVDPASATMFFYAHLEAPKFLYSEAFEELEKKEPLKANLKYKQMGEQLTAVSKKLADLPVKLTPETRSKLDFQVDVLQKFSNLGQAEVEYREGKFDKVLEYSKSTVDAVLQKDTGTEPIKRKDYEVTGNIIGLALRAEVQKGNADQAKKLLGVLKRLRGDEENPNFQDSSGGIVRNLLADVASQFRTLKKEGDTAKLKALTESFGKFLDALRQDYDPKKAPVQDIQLLADAYTSLDQQQKAAELYAQVPAPAVLEKASKDMKEEDLKEVQNYWSLKLRQAEALRKSKDFKGSLQILDELLKHKNAMFQIYAEMEKNFNYEDDEKYGFAAQRWIAFMKNPSLVKNLQNPQQKKIYFEGYFYQIRCLFLYAKLDPAVKDRQKLYDHCGKQILKLEYTPGKDGWGIVGDRFVELMAAHSELKTAYDRFKPDYEKAAKIAAGKQ